MSVQGPSLSDKDNARRLAELAKQERVAQLKATQEANRRLQEQAPSIIIPASTNTVKIDPYISGIGSGGIQYIPPPSKSTASLSIEDLQNELYKRKQDLIKKADNVMLDADFYRVNIPTIKLLTEDKTEKERNEYIGNLAVITSVPIIIVCAYIGEIYGFSPDLEAKMESLMKFYTVKEVLNVRRPK